jgi:hypothetical protein
MNKKEVIIYERYRKLIFNRAWAWQLRTGKDVEELVADGNLVFCKCLQNHDKEKSSFSTYLYNSLQMHFGNMVNISWSLRSARHLEQGDLEPDQCGEFSTSSPQQEAIFRQIINNLSTDSKEVIKAIFETPLEIIEVFGITKVTKACLRDYFRQCRGWQFKRIKAAFAEIHKAIL